MGGGSGGGVCRPAAVVGCIFSVIVVMVHWRHRRRGLPEPGGARAAQGRGYLGLLSGLGLLPSVRATCCELSLDGGTRHGGHGRRARGKPTFSAEVG
ncbi:unnamed protein product [Prorocentrum cordatum]|uniref:Uncharacterized protein n=1 Tax=Prorocentrum cordatum TaxID=2364126 RepID=A0ABN9PVV0_9DINO|nr:unnamed protein product [Polarella glacialis]